MAGSRRGSGRGTSGQEIYRYLVSGLMDQPLIQRTWLLPTRDVWPRRVPPGLWEGQGMSTVNE